MYSTKFIKKEGRREGCRKEEKQGEVGRGGREEEERGGEQRRPLVTLWGGNEGQTSACVRPHTERTLNTKSGQEAVSSGQITVARLTPQFPDVGTCPARQEGEMKEQSGAQLTRSLENATPGS